MKTKSWLFAIGFCALLLSGCAASVGVGADYGYYPPVHAYYAPVRPYYYPPRPVVVVPRYYRPPYRSHYDGYRRDGGNNGYGNYGHSRRRLD
ncbi:hypothetical protein AUC43_12445 [Hymenobacter sedentarius]|uniref:Lipoprotein n=1 Tax=Hymenobacter sedentarius TaxID=1411621 RepID=A0A0U3SI75_9BACT|nr:hypothetical protein [Hymenobacter sedentarius]ALW85830.1 hypothetical protein AUC43_12445 [Hymenobacter sedentarius]